MTSMMIGGRGVAAAALALPLTLLLIGAGGGLIFDPNTPIQLMGTPYWIVVFWGLCELALGVAVWIPYLHRLVGLVIAVDAVAQVAIHSAYGRRGWVIMYGIIVLMSTAIVALWTSKRVALPGDRSHLRTAAA
jgi:hypothetical protein